MQAVAFPADPRTSPSRRADGPAHAPATGPETPETHASALYVPDGSAQKTVLMLVQLSSLDSFAWYCAKLNKTRRMRALQKALTGAIVTHCGPIVVTDQRWPDIRSDLRTQVLAALRQHPPVLDFHFDEDTEEWDVAMPQFTQALAAVGLGSEAVIRLGGVWASQNSTSGGVNATHEWLTRLGYRHVSVDPTICGYEFDDSSDSPEH